MRASSFRSQALASSRGHSRCFLYASASPMKSDKFLRCARLSHPKLGQNIADESGRIFPLSLGRRHFIQQTLHDCPKTSCEEESDGPGIKWLSEFHILNERKDVFGSVITISLASSVLTVDLISPILSSFHFDRATGRL